jgi:N-acetyl-anhydromuramyl-L-alanine amidase AmpD
MKLKIITYITLFCIISYTTKAINYTRNFSDTLIRIIDKPISYNDERKKLSIEYLKNRHGIVQNTPNIEPIMIVLHYTGSGTVNSIHNYFNQTKIEGGRKLNKNQSELNVSAHYVVDRDGTIYRLVPENMFCRHTIGLNYCSIGVENIGGKNQPLTEKQIIANSNLIRYLCKRYNIQYVIGHSEYLSFKNTKFWKESNSNYITHKEDPGDIFLMKVRKNISDLSIKYKP